MINPVGRSMTSFEILVLKNTSGFGTQIYQISSRHLVISESTKTTKYHTRVLSKGLMSQLQEVPIDQKLDKIQILTRME